MSTIKEIYTDGILKTDFKSAAVLIDGNRITDRTKFNIFNRNILDLNQASDFVILYTLQVLKDEKRDQHLAAEAPKTLSLAGENGTSVTKDNGTGDTARESLNGIQIKDPKTKSLVQRRDPLNGIQIKEPTKNRSSITINGSAPPSPQTFVRINGNLVTDFSNIELYLDGKKVKDVNITIVIEIKKDSLLKYVRLAKK